jgi:hypothetical protein
MFALVPYFQSWMIDYGLFVEYDGRRFGRTEQVDIA